MRASRLLAAAAVVTVYVLCPAYRYYVIGSWVGYKILCDRPRPYRVVAKGSKVVEGA